MFLERVAFGPTGGEYLLYDVDAQVYNCFLHVPHTNIRCLIPAGFGKGHYFTVKVAGQKTDSSSITSLTMMSYKAPVVSSVQFLSGVSSGGYTLVVEVFLSHEKYVLII